MAELGHDLLRPDALADQQRDTGVPELMHGQAVESGRLGRREPHAGAEVTRTNRPAEWWGTSLPTSPVGAGSWSDLPCLGMSLCDGTAIQTRFLRTSFS